MKELEQLKKLIEGYQKLIDEINSWGPQPKPMQANLDTQKSGFRQVIEMGKIIERFLVKLGPEEVAESIGMERIQNSLITWASQLRQTRIGLKDWEALVKKDSVKSQ